MNNLSQNQLLNEFLQTKEGREAHDKFVKEQEKWYFKKIGQPNPNEKVEELSNQINNIEKMLNELMGKDNNGK